MKVDIHGSQYSLHREITKQLEVPKCAALHVNNFVMIPNPDSINSEPKMQAVDKAHEMVNFLRNLLSKAWLRRLRHLSHHRTPEWRAHGTFKFASRCCTSRLVKASASNLRLGHVLEHACPLFRLPPPPGLCMSQYRKLKPTIYRPHLSSLCGFGRSDSLSCLDE